MHRASQYLLVVGLKVLDVRDWLLHAVLLKLFPDDEVAVLVEHKQVGECVEENIIVCELLAPGTVEVDKAERACLLVE